MAKRPRSRPICFYFTVDVECSAEEVLVDLRTLFDQHGVRATFFVTMCGTPGPERGPRPNFRRNSDTYRRLRETHGEIALADEDRARPRRSSALAFAPEAKGLRAHSLYYDSAVLPLLPLYRRLGVEYDCSYQMPLLGGLRPFRKHHEIVELLTCYGDHFDVMTGATGISWRREDRVQARARRSSTFSWR